MSWFDPPPPDAPFVQPRQMPKMAVPSLIGDGGLVYNALMHKGAGTVLRDYAPGGNHGAIFGNVGWIDGAWGWALEFGGAAGDYVLVTPVTANWATAISIEAWFRHPKDGAVRDIARRPGSWAIEKPAIEVLDFYINIGGIPRAVHIPALAWTANTWTHLAFDITATTAGGDGQIRGYINGGAPTIAGPWAGAITGAVHSYLGTYNGAIRMWADALPMFRVYNRALGQAGFNDHFQKTRHIFEV